MSHTPARVSRQALVVALLVLLLATQDVHGKDSRVNKNRSGGGSKTPKLIWSRGHHDKIRRSYSSYTIPKPNYTAPKPGKTAQVHNAPVYTSPSQQYPPALGWNVPKQQGPPPTNSNTRGPPLAYNPANKATAPVTNNGSSNNINRQSNGSTSVPRPRMNSTGGGGYHPPVTATNSHGAQSSYPGATLPTASSQANPSVVGRNVPKQQSPPPPANNPANKATPPVTNNGQSNSINRQSNGSTQYTPESASRPRMNSTGGGGYRNTSITATNTHGAQSGFPSATYNTPTTVQPAPGYTALVHTASSHPNPLAVGRNVPKQQVSPPPANNAANKATAPVTNNGQSSPVNRQSNGSTQYTPESASRPRMNSTGEVGYHTPVTATNTHGAQSSYPSANYPSNLSPTSKTSSVLGFGAGFIAGALHGALSGHDLTSTQNRKTDDGSSLSGGGGGSKYNNRNDDKGPPGSVTTTISNKDTTVHNTGTAEVAPALASRGVQPLKQTPAVAPVSAAPLQPATAVPAPGPAAAPVSTVNVTHYHISVPLAPLHDAHSGAKAVSQWSTLSPLLTILVAYCLH